MQCPDTLRLAKSPLQASVSHLENRGLLLFFTLFYLLKEDLYKHFLCVRCQTKLSAS